MKKFTIQHSFANGVLDPRMAARLDIKQYYQGVEVGQNIRFLPQGGLAKRGGLKYIDEVAGNGRLIPFIFNTDQKYICVFSNLLIEIYRADTLALVDTVVTLYTIADIPELDYAQSADTMFIVHENYPVRQLVRGATDADFTIADVTFAKIPQYDFNDASSPTPVSEVQVINFNDPFEEGDTFKITLEGIETDILSFLEDDSPANITDMESRIANALQDLSITGNTGISASNIGTNDEYSVTFAGESANDWEMMSVTVVTYQGGDSGKGKVTRTTAGSSRKEDTWSATRGYPRTTTFFEGRLWFGGSRDLPNTLWGSRTNNLLNFDLGKSRDDDAIYVTLDTDQINRIQAMFGGRNLQVFTVGGEFAFRKAVSDPITPENVSVQSQTQYGSKRITPVSIGGAVLFVQRTGKAIREFVFNFDEEAYDSPSITTLSPNVVIDPVDIQAQKGFASDDASYVYITNSDGTVSMYNIDRANEVAAWSTWVTEGDFVSCAVAIDEAFFLVKRTIDGVDKYYLEKVEEDNFLDSYVTTVSGTSATGLDHLDSKPIYVATDDYRVIKGLTVPTTAAYTVTLPYSVTSGIAGLPYTAKIHTLPAVQDNGAGFDLSSELRITRCTLEVYETMQITVNGNKMVNKNTPQTGRFSATLMGWSKTPNIRIEQPDPFPLTILGINLEVDG